MLEEALLDAAWAELTECGYDELTIDAVAVRAGTSRAVLYRRWPGKQELVHAALVYQVGKDIVVAPDTGTLRGDVLALLRQANMTRVHLATLLFTQLGDFYRQSHTSLSELSAFIQGGRDSMLDDAIQRAVARDEIRPGQISDRVARASGRSVPLRDPDDTAARRRRRDRRDRRHHLPAARPSSKRFGRATLAAGKHVGYRLLLLARHPQPVDGLDVHLARGEVASKRLIRWQP